MLFAKMPFVSVWTTTSRCELACCSPACDIAPHAWMSAPGPCMVTMVVVTCFLAGIAVGVVLTKRLHRQRRDRALHDSQVPNVLDFDELQYPVAKATELITKYLHDLYQPDDPTTRKPFKYSVLPKIRPGDVIKQLPKAAPSAPESWQSILHDFESIILPNVGHWQSPSFHAYFKGFVPSSCLVGEFLSTSLNCVGFSWLSSPAATELEQVVVEWMRQIFGFPSCFSFASGGGGIINGTASESMLNAFVAARNQALAGLTGQERTQKASRLMVYCSDQTHCVVQKCSIVLDFANLHVIPTRRGEADQDNYGLDPGDLELAMKQDIEAGFVPLVVVPTVGTTSTAAVDPVEAICKVARGLQPDVWIHVDAAFGGNGALCPENRKWFAGLDQCDSICVNAHKWMLMNLGCSVFWVQERHRLTNSLTLHPEYLKNEHQDEINYKDWQIPLSRRFQSLRVWFHLRRFGQEGLRAHIRQSIAYAKLLEQLLLADGRFEIFVPTRMALVCFNVANQPRRVTEELLRRANQSGRIFLIQSVVDGTFILRLGVGGLEMTQEKVTHAVEVLSEELDGILAEQV